VLPYAPLAIHCFAGAGGLSLGLQKAGFVVGAAFDCNGPAVRTYARNLGAHIIQARVQELKGADLLAIAGRRECEIVVGGPPCQGFSRQRRGEDRDERNDLVFEFLRIVIEIRPELFLMENVAGIYGKRGNGVLPRMLSEAHAAGYHVSTTVLNAADFGVPQHRRRAFIVGERGDRPPCFGFPSPTHNSESWIPVRAAIGDLPDPSGTTRLANHEPDQMSELNRKRLSHVPPGGGRADIPEHLRLPCHAVDVETAGHRGVYGRLWWDRPAGTITTKCNSFTRGRFGHPEANRNITMREAARLQSFPDDFVFLGGRVDVAHQIGNAVPPLLGEHLGRALLEALSVRATGIIPARLLSRAIQLDFFSHCV